MHRSGGGSLFRLLASLSPPPGDAYRYPTGSTRSTLYASTKRQLQIQACAFFTNSGSEDLIFS
ncbi:hypothetical protein LF1_59000 [Rubripirellula obstinata]|uniref:Uncharacterized protein n=1 Tax=Rubripirellula obstinata TaxID=406547 RepID=A0A5B1C6V4_9BACT|nr:hypothetical protein LF1_59000 [Rubripirellula obstinata]